MRKLNGYRPTHRNKWRFIQYGILNLQELALLEFYADIFDFDKGHELFGLFKVNFNEVAGMFRCKSANTVRNWHNKLLSTGFIEKTSQNNVFRLKCFRRFIHSGFWNGKVDDYAKREVDQPIEVILQNFDIDPHLVGVNFQPVANKSDILASEINARVLGSYKDESRDYQDNQLKELRSIKTDEEYKLVKARVEKLGKIIGDNWFSDNPRIKKLVQEHQHLANKMLEYEIEHDLIPI